MPRPRSNRSAAGKSVEALRHEQDTRTNIPTAEYQSMVREEQESPRTPEGITEEGIAGYFTYGLNANVALSVQAGTNPLPSRGG